MSSLLTRRALVGGVGLGLLSGCDKVASTGIGRSILLSSDKLTMGVQRTLLPRDALAPEFSAAEMSPRFRVNGTLNPNTPDYNAHVASNFADWRLAVGGMVDYPLSLSLAQLRALPARTQITRHDCVEGWSAIGKWHGPLLGTLLKAARVKQQARYVVFTCADLYHGQPYYESIDLIDAFHPQTILAWAMNDRPLDVGHGAPVRLRVERQLGYKQAKYVMRIDAVDDLSRIRGGRGGYWEDSTGYDWYAGA
jgi:DMSO/TMAO reductase YedYZ molybdopterin-dependent catalytic subunit